MPPRTFDTLVQFVGPHIRKKDTNFRKAISPEHRLAQTVRFLAAGETLRSSCFSFLNGRSTACGIVSSVCQVLWDVLGPLYVACPSSADEWLQIASEFEERWNMPHCVGAIDGKHVAIECPSKSGSEDYNYKNCFSKSLLAISDACYRYMLIIDALLVLTLIMVSSMQYNYVQSEVLINSLHPFLAASTEEEQLHRDQGDSALTSHFAEPHSKRIFNYRLSRARRVIENAFGIMAQKWRILRRQFKANDDNVRRSISACVVLHNFLLKESPTSRSAYCPPGTADHLDWQGNITEGITEHCTSLKTSLNTALPPLRSTGCHSTRAAYRVRDLLAKYFVTDGKIPWQEYMIKDRTLCSGE
ncbi:uncharacterized protein LOC119466062 [Dermacentor silvarum]|uniref:uncharacterized protein LOC119466062 n=1 Tax=Dermacentor silvarum TaxID=543639 RepID=UPI002100C784|nr:uncharacterized protein LOC119466062 [Dermacentor silvarum]